MPQVRGRYSHGLAGADGPVVGPVRHHDLQRRLRGLRRFASSGIARHARAGGMAGGSRVQPPRHGHGAGRRGDVVSRQALQPEASRRSGRRVDQPRLQPRGRRRRQACRACSPSSSTRRLGCMPNGPSARANPASAHLPTTSPLSHGWRTRRATSTGTTSDGSTTRACRSTSPNNGAGRRCSTRTMPSACWKRSAAAWRPAKCGKIPFR